VARRTRKVHVSSLVVVLALGAWSCGAPTNDNVAVAGATTSSSRASATTSSGSALGKADITSSSGFPTSSRVAPVESTSASLATTTSVSAVPTSGAAGTTSTSGTRPGSLLARKDVPPSGVAAQFVATSGAGAGPCFRLPMASRALVVQYAPLGGSGATESVMHAMLCFAGFLPGKPVDVSVNLPDGTRKSFAVPALPEAKTWSADEQGKYEWSPSLHWYVQPGDPMGDYSVNGSQDGTQITGGFAVRPVQGEHIYVIPRELKPGVSGRPGTTFIVGLLGFRPNAPITFYIYRRLTQPGRPMVGFVTSMTTQANGAGQLRYELVTSSSDPPGTYCVVLPERARNPDPLGDGACVDSYVSPDLFVLK
jgi:hypothetical protein